MTGTRTGAAACQLLFWHPCRFNCFHLIVACLHCGLSSFVCRNYCWMSACIGCLNAFWSFYSLCRPAACRAFLWWLRHTFGVWLFSRDWCRDYIEWQTVMCLVACLTADVAGCTGFWREGKTNLDGCIGSKTPDTRVKLKWDAVSTFQISKVRLPVWFF